MASKSYLLMKLLHNHPERMGLALLSLAAGKESNPEVDLSGYMERMAEMADGIYRQLPPTPAIGDIIYAINTRLFDEEMFRCDNSAELDSPFLHRLLDEHHAHLITLSVLYLTIGRLLDLSLECVTLSGRLLVRVVDGAEGALIDPAAGGVVLTEEELQHLFLSKFEFGTGLAPRYQTFLQRLDDRALMVRLLRLHKELYLAEEKHESALQMINIILDLSPENGEELLERARLMELLQRHEDAAVDYMHYLELCREPSRHNELKQRMQLLLAVPAMLH